ncbi:MAG: hypothetical protein ACT4NY_32490 [Pseudonocardiales bacterium]
MPGNRTGVRHSSGWSRAPGLVQYGHGSGYNEWVGWAVADKVIDNPILNRPYDEPSRHFAFDDEGITDRIVDARRPSSYFVPVPRPRKGTRQLELAELTADQIRPNELVNRIREQVTRWRHAGCPRVTPTTRRLLEHWSDPERENRVLFCAPPVTSRSPTNWPK